jgi:hypothetical protein
VVRRKHTHNPLLLAIYGFDLRYFDRLLVGSGPIYCVDARRGEYTCSEDTARGVAAAARGVVAAGAGAGAAAKGSAAAAATAAAAARGAAAATTKGTEGQQRQPKGMDAETLVWVVRYDAERDETLVICRPVVRFCPLFPVTFNRKMPFSRAF